MIGIVWNVRGLRGKHAFQNFQRLVAINNPDFVFVSEAKLFSKEAMLMKSRLRFDYVFCVDPSGFKGGLLLFWNDHIRVNILSFSPGHIDCMINTAPSPFYFTGFYGNPSKSDRHLSWLLLNKIGTSHNSTQLPWLVEGILMKFYTIPKRKVVISNHPWISRISRMLWAIMVCRIFRLRDRNLHGTTIENTPTRF